MLPLFFILLLCDACHFQTTDKQLTVQEVILIVVMGDSNGRDFTATGPTSVTEWAQTQRQLLRLERDEEKSQVADTISNLPAQVI